MFYTVDENNNITASADDKFDDNCLETEQKIIRDIDGILQFASYLETPEYKARLAEKEQEIKRQSKIAELKQFLEDTDYIPIRQIEENTLSEQEYSEIKEKRQAAREEINTLGG